MQHIYHLAVLTQSGLALQWFLETWNASHAVLGIIAVIAIQRAVHKVLIAVFLSREFKHDETNRAWWTGRWYGRGLGSHVMSQPAREFIVKIIELSLWSSDLLIGHFLLFMLTPPILFPYADRLHAMLLCELSRHHFSFIANFTSVWLRPSKQIRAPLYSLKQKKQRRWIVSDFEF
jgi:1,3-beta-glucan synthase